MRIGLIDVDAVNNHGPKFPNLALMRISAWHKAQGDEVEWWWTDLIHYDIVYMSKVFSDTYRKKGHCKTVYVLTNFNSTMEENLHRIYTLRDMNYDPFVMIYDKPSAPIEIRDLQRWCNNKVIFKKCRRFEDYKPTREKG